MVADVSIYSMLRPTQPQEGPLDQYGKMLSLKNMIDQSQLSELQRTKLSTDLQEEQAFKDAFRGGAEPGKISIADLFRASPTRALQYQKTDLENQKTTADLAKSKTENFAAGTKVVHDLIASASSDADMPQIKEAMTRFMGPEYAARVPDTFTPQWQQQAVMNGEKLLDRVKPDWRAVAAGGTSVMRQMNPNAPGFSAEAVPHTVTPDAKMVDARMREMMNPVGAGSPDYERQLNYWADVVQKGGTLPPGLARGAAGSAFVREVTKRAAMGEVTPEDMMANQAGFVGEKAGQRTLGTRTANIEMAATEAASLADLAKQASAKVDRTQFKAFNDVMQAGQRATASPELRAFTASNTSLINAYARAINPQGVGTVADKEHARDMLSTAFSKGDYDAAINQLMQEIDAARKSPGTVKKEMRDRFTGKEQPQGAAEPSKTASGGIKFLGWEK